MTVERHISNAILRLRRGDITVFRADALGNAANQWLAGGGGVDGAIHRAGGPAIMEECRKIGGCLTGSAVATGAGDLQARHVIHAVAPRWTGGNRGERELLAGAYRRSMEVAGELGDRSVALPSLGTGAYGYPLREAADIALRTVAEYLQSNDEVDEVTFVLYSERDLLVFREALEALPIESHRNH